MTESSPAIVGHAVQCAGLQRDLEGGRRAHAYLFAGRRHLGKLTVARWFAREILLAEKSEEERGGADRLLRRNTHPDLLTLDQLWIEDICTDWKIIAQSSNVPQEKRVKRRVKTDTIGIDDIRSLQERLYEKPEGGTLCCLIRSIERLNAEAANSLLKILEEPPSSVVFCCTTESLSALLPTIVSRMRIVHFSPVPARDLILLLSAVEEGERSLLLRIAQGAPGIIFRCLKDIEMLRKLRETHDNAHRFLDSRSRRERLEQLESALKGKEEELFLRHVLLHLEEQLGAKDARTAAEALRFTRSILDLFQALRANAQRPLLALELALHLSSS